MLKKFIDYVKASLTEMKKVSWPSKKETTQYTILVIAISLAIAAFLGGLDYVFNLALNMLIK